MSSTDSELKAQIRKCFRDSYMQTEGETELFDTEETITAIEKLIAQKVAEAEKRGRESENEIFLFAARSSKRQGETIELDTIIKVTEDRLATLKEGKD